MDVVKNMKNKTLAEYPLLRRIYNRVNSCETM